MSIKLVETCPLIVSYAAAVQDNLPIAIVGAGFSGTLLAVNLLRLGQPVVLIEREPTKLARGQAFAARIPEHLLNVRAANMSAFPDDADHFVRWMGFATEDQKNRFVPRLTYGEYLREQLGDGLAASGGLGEIRGGEAVSLRFSARSAVLGLADGLEIACRTVVLALGNLPPAPMPALGGLPGEFLAGDPWAPAALDGLDEAGHVLLVGTGLTAVDVALTLDREGYGGRITALSRRGLRPRAHAESGPKIGPVERPSTRGSLLLRAIRRRARDGGWRAAVDELRPHVQDLWRAHSAEEQRRFLRHARPYWDVHRHRLAPEVDARIAELEGAGRLRFVAGELIGAEPQGRRAAVDLRRRGGGLVDRIVVDRIINCTGPNGDLRRAPDRLIRQLLREGRIRPDVHRLGLDVGPVGRVRDGAGRPHDRLFAVGPIAKGEAWEIVAVPDIRRQVWSLARFLANAHWVGGEGL